MNIVVKPILDEAQVLLEAREQLVAGAASNAQLQSKDVLEAAGRVAPPQGVTAETVTAVAKQMAAYLRETMSERLKDAERKAAARVAPTLSKVWGLPCQMTGLGMASFALLLCGDALPHGHYDNLRSISEQVWLVAKTHIDEIKVAAGPNSPLVVRMKAFGDGGLISLTAIKKALAAADGFSSKERTPGPRRSPRDREGAHTGAVGEHQMFSREYVLRVGRMSDAAEIYGRQQPRSRGARAWAN